jgi:hypothetical protein
VQYTVIDIKAVYKNMEANIPFKYLFADKRLYKNEQTIVKIIR